MVEVPTRRAVALAVGDHLAIAAVVAWGIVDHHGVDGLTEPPVLLRSIAPFLVGFLVAAAIVGCYRRSRTRSLLPALRSVLGAWLGGLGIGLVIRTHPELEGGATWPFGLVVLLSVAVGLLVWRLCAHGAWRYRSVLTGRPEGEPAGE